MTKILFVCLGNICRSPLAEAIFNEKLKKMSIESQFGVDSAGTGNYHVGEGPDRRTIEVASKHSIPIHSIARQLHKDDFHDFDYIITMDEQNFQDAGRLKPSNSKAQLLLMREFDNDKDMNVPDPYFGGSDGFEEVFSILDQSTDGLLDFLQKESRKID